MGRNSALALVALSLSVLAVAVASAASNASPQDSQTRVQACVTSANPAWSEPERRVWQSLCNGKTADLSTNGESAFSASIGRCLATFTTYQLPIPPADSFKNDPSRRVSGQFLEQILGDDAYAHYLRDTPIRIRGAYITSTRLQRATVYSLRIDDSLIDSIDLTNVKADAGLSFCDADHVSGLLALTNITATTIDFYNVRIAGDVTIEDSSISDLEIVRAQSADSIRVQGLRGASSIFMNENDAKNISISESTAPEMSVLGTTVSMLSFYRLDIARRLSMSGISWRQGMPPAAMPPAGCSSTLTVRDTSVSEFNYAPTKTSKPDPTKTSEPDCIDFVASTFGSIFLGDDPLSFWGRVNQSPQLKGLRETLPDLYAATAKTYAARGRQSTARELLYQKNILEDAAEYEITHQIDVPRWISRNVVGYGYYPERGLLVLAFFVVLGWGIFASGEAKLTGSSRPYSWLVFSLDTVIPILVLDSRNDQVSFRGYRQYYLYFMRALGAGLAFLVFAYLKQTFIGPE
jgi:hypothetical protein